jgi:hypothetical protein
MVSMDLEFVFDRQDYDGKRSYAFPCMPPQITESSPSMAAAVEQNAASSMDDDLMLGIPIPEFASESILYTSAPLAVGLSTLDWHDRPISPSLGSVIPSAPLSRRQEGNAGPGQLPQNSGRILPFSLPEMHGRENMIPYSSFHASKNSPIATTSSFSPQSSSTRHLCNVCGCRFWTASRLKRHQHLQHNATKFTCTHCDCAQKFGRRDNLVRHLRRKHGDLSAARELCSQSEPDHFRVDESTDDTKHFQIVPLDHRSLV